MLAAVDEIELGADHEVLHRARDQDLVGVGERAHPGADVDGHAANVVAAELALARVQAGPHLKAQRADAVPDRAGALDPAGGPVEGGEEAVAQRS